MIYDNNNNNNNNRSINKFYIISQNNMNSYNYFFKFRCLDNARKDDL